MVDLKEVLRKHELWFRGEKGGKRANLSGSDLRDSDLSGSNLSYSNLSYSLLSGSDLSGSNLSGSDLRDSNLSGTKGLISPSEFMVKNFEKTDEGYIAYKVFGYFYPTPEHWEIEKGSVISEVVNYTRTDECGCGVNVATLNWIRRNIEIKKADIWKVLIRWEWLCDICVPYNSDGKIRCERVELLEVINN